MSAEEAARRIIAAGGGASRLGGGNGGGVPIVKPRKLVKETRLTAASFDYVEPDQAADVIALVFSIPLGEGFAEQTTVMFSEGGLENLLAQGRTLLEARRARRRANSGGGSRDAAPDGA